MSNMKQLKQALESDSLVQSRTIELTVEDNELTVREFGNPALEVDDSRPPNIVETGETHLPNRIQYIADSVLGFQNFACSVYEDTDESETKITI